MGTTEIVKLAEHIANNLCGDPKILAKSSLFEENPMWKYWKDFYTKEIEKLIEQEKALSRQEGEAFKGKAKREAYQQGFKEGEAEGYRKALEDLKNVYEIRIDAALKTDNEKKADQALFAWGYFKGVVRALKDSRGEEK